VIFVVLSSKLELGVGTLGIIVSLIRNVHEEANNQLIGEINSTKRGLLEQDSVIIKNYHQDGYRKRRLQASNNLIVVDEWEVNTPS